MDEPHLTSLPHLCFLITWLFKYPCYAAYFNVNALLVYYDIVALYIFSVDFLYHVITVVTGTVLLVVLDNASSIFSLIVLK